MNRNFFLKLAKIYFNENKPLFEKIVSKTDLYEQYVDAVLKWNSNINITGFNEEEFIFSGVIEPLIIFKYLNDFKGSVSDIGAGSGIPSVAISVFQEKCIVNAVEINKKKSAFLNHLKFGLKINNLNVLKKSPSNVSLLTSRAFTGFEKFLFFIKKERLKCENILFFFKKTPPEKYKFKHVETYKNYFNKGVYSQAIYDFNEVIHFLP